MRLSSRLSSVAMCAGAVALFGSAVAGPLARAAAPSAQVALPSSQQVLPDSPGREAFVRVCSGCHSTSLATVQRKSADDWATVVLEMQGRGATGSDDDMQGILTHLSTNFGSNTPLPHVKINTASAAEIAGTLSLSLAQGGDIVAYRDKNGAFKDVAALDKVPGTDAAKIEAAKDRIDF